MFNDMHSFSRYFCLLGSFTQGIIDAMSSFIVSNYLIQVKQNSAPTELYSIQLLNFYYWRDIISFGFCIWIILTCLHLCCIIGFLQPQLISYPQITGGEIDRPNVFQKQRKIRQIYDYL